MAVGWAGLIAGVGLVVAADRPNRVALAIAVVLFALAGFLAGLRSEDRRVMHAILGTIAGAAFYLVFVAITAIVDIVGGPGRAEVIPAGPDGWKLRLPMLLGAAIGGGLFAMMRLRPQGEPRHRRRAN